jgi:hypothetical protein
MILTMLLSLQVWQSGPKEDEYIVCDGTGEDPACSDSLQYWDRSIAAHLVRLFFPEVTSLHKIMPTRGLILDQSYCLLRIIAR